jgi:hypothetical protein
MVAPKFVEQQSVSQVEVWPKEGEEKDKITVLCSLEGGEYLGPDGQFTTRWYRIVVPKDKAEPKVVNGGEVEPTEGGYIAYIGAPWVEITGAQPLPC